MNKEVTSNLILAKIKKERKKVYKPDLSDNDEEKQNEL